MLKRFLLVSLLVTCSGFAATSAFGPETALTPPSLTEPPSVQISVSVATNGDGFLAAWYDYRDQNGVYATRIDANGRVIDQPSFFISAEPGVLTLLGAGRDTILASATCGGLDLMRIGEDKRISAPTHIDTSHSGCIYYPSLATNGETILLVYAGTGVLLDLNLRVIKAFNFDPSASMATVASNGHDYVAVTAPRSTFARSTHIDRNGAIVSAQDIVFPRVVESLAIASSGNDFLAIAGGEVLGVQRLNVDGFPIDAGRAIEPESPPRGVMRPSIVWSGTDYITSYMRQTASLPEVMVLRLTPAADLAAQRTVSSSYDPGTNIAIRAGSAIVVWAAPRATAEIVSPQTLAPIGSPHPLSFSATTQFTPKLVNVGSSLAAVWLERTFEQASLKAMIVGAPASEKTLISGLLPRDYSVAFDGTNLVVLWQADITNAITLQRFHANLTPLDFQPFVITGTEPLGRATFAAGIGKVLIAWPAWDGSQIAMKAALLNTTAQLTAPLQMTISAAPFNNHDAAVAWNGKDFMVVWAHATGTPPSYELDPTPPDDVVARRVSATGTLLGIVPKIVAVPNKTLGTTSIASNGGDFFATWVQRNVPSRPLIAGAFVGAALTMPATSGTAIGEVDDGVPALAPFGGGYVVAWPAVGSAINFYTPSVRVISSNGTPGTTFTLPEVPHAFVTEDVVFASGMLLYDRIGTELQYGGMRRLFTRLFTPALPRRRATR
jgi:hypothetical protein